MLPDRDRLFRRAAQPRLVTLHRALGRLKSPITVMNTGAHPDDEHSDMLAVLRHQLGMRVVIACSTRGEGGQNVLGPERGGALGVLRSREMEEAARALDADIAWLGHGTDDPVHDFGFSKSGSDTLARWGRERTVERLVRAYRQYRPDIVIPTFLDVPGQHGHHRAMTEAAITALALAADPEAFPEHLADGLPPWRVEKFYLPAWSGGGDTYDDEVPPPPETTRVTATGVDAATGMRFDRLGEVSRAYHASQNMGFWRVSGSSAWGLHLLNGAPEADIRAGLPARLADIAALPALAEADAALAEAGAAFPQAEAVIAALLRAKEAITRGAGGLSAGEAAAHGHRLTRKQREIDAALALAAGLDIAIAIDRAGMTPGSSGELIVDLEPGRATAVTLRMEAAEDFVVPAPVQVEAGRTALPLSARADAQVGNGFYPGWDSLGGNGAVSVRADMLIGGAAISIQCDCEEPVRIAPAHALGLAPEAMILTLPASGERRIALKPDTARVTVDAAPGLSVRQVGSDLVLMPYPDLTPGRHFLAVRVDGASAHAVTPIAYPHIGRTRFARPLTLDILALDLKLPEARIGYVGGGSDNVGLWLDRMGAKPVPLAAADLAGDLSGFDTIVIGIFAYGTRPDLLAANARLHQWVRDGGNLVTLYHRPGDNWVSQDTPPKPISIGTPSLRWRVTDPAAPVQVLEPEHPLLAGPNRITAEDFDGWDKERGLYFAASWDAAYTPLLAMSDAGEAPLTGALISGRIGKGRHTHTSLVLHHQLDKLVPGAFRLLANLVQKA